MTPRVYIFEAQKFAYRMLLSLYRSFVEFFLMQDRFIIASFAVRKNIFRTEMSWLKYRGTNNQFRTCGVIYKKEGKLVIILTARLPSIFAKEILTS